MTDADRKATQGPAVAVLAGAVLVVIGTLMTWITVAGGLAVFDRSGVNYDADAKVMIVLAVLAALAAVGELTDLEVLPGLVKAAPLLDGVIVAALGCYDVSQLRDRVAAAKASAPGIEAHVGSGVYVAIAGGVLIAMSGYRLWEARKQQEPDFTPTDEQARARVGGDW